MAKGLPILVLFSLFVSGCVEVPKKREMTVPGVSPKKRSAKSAEKSRSELKNRLPAKKQNVASKKTESQKMAQSKQGEFKSETTLPEQFYYSGVIRAYRKSDKSSLYENALNLIKNYPLSIHADNALYLLGRHELKHRDLGRALIHFNRLIKDYPGGNKVMAAKLAKAVTLREMHLDENAKETLEELINTYPGSPESLQASIQLRMLSVGGKK